MARIEAVEPADDEDTSDRAWTIKPMPYRERKAAKQAAERLGQTIGDWMAEAIRAKIALEHAPRDGRRYDVLAPGERNALTVIDAGPPLSLAEMAQAVELAARLQELSATGKLPNRFAGAMRRKLRERMGLAIAQPGRIVPPDA